MIDSLKCDFVVSELNPNLIYCKTCNMVLSNMDPRKDNAFCNVKLHNASLNPNSSVKLVDKQVVTSDNNSPESSYTCTQEQIDSRLNICNSCPFYKNNTCLQCGCSLSRDKNYKNKLYHADQSCPIGKWGPTT